MDDVVQLQYMGNNAGRERITSPTHKGTSYTFSSGSPLAYVFKSDLDKLLSYRIPGTNDPLFTIVPKSEQKQETVIVESGTPLVSEEPRQAEIPNLSIDALPLEEHVVTKLRKGGIDTLRQLQEASDTDLLAIKGIGQQRVDEIREVAHQWISS